MNRTELRRIADAYGTPLYVFDERELARRAKTLRAALPASVRLCYAMKANTFVLPELASRVERVEACSPGEFRICRTLGVDPGKVVVSGVHKDEETVRAALSSEILPAAVTVESPAQMELVARVAREFSVRAPVLLRFTSGNQFGLDRADLEEAVHTYRKSREVKLLGVQYFSGTQKTSAKRLQRELDKLMRLLSELEQDCGWRARELEWGPGLPVSYFDADDFDEAALLAELSRMIEVLPFEGQVTLELGRSLAASCGTYLTRVVDAKRNRGQRYAIVDGGMHQIVYYGNSMALKQPHVELLNAPSPTAYAPAPEKDGAWSLCGSLCTANDILAKQVDLPGLDVGSVVAFGQAGAYCATEGMSLFLSRDLPRVAVIAEDGSTRLVRGNIPTSTLNSPQKL